MLTIFTVIGYFLILVVIAIRHRKSRRGQDTYFVAGRNSRFAVVFGSLGATVIGGSATIGLTGLAARNGFAPVVWLLGGAAGLILAGFLVAPRATLSRVYTVPEYLDRYYGKGIRWGAAVIIVLSWTGVIGAQLIAAGWLLATVFPVSQPIASIVTGVVIAGYVWVGGQQSVIRTDLFQFCVILGGLGVLFLALTGQVGGSTVSTTVLATALDQLWNSLPSQITGWIALFLVIGLSFATGPDVFSRFLCARDPQPSKKAAWSVGAILVPFAFMVASLGILGARLLPGQNGDSLLPDLARVAGPDILHGLVMAALLAAVMSSADTCIMTAATILAMETGGDHSGTREHLVGRMSVAIPVVVVLSVAVAWLAPTILGALLGAYLVYTAAISPLLLPVLISGRRVGGRRMSGIIVGCGVAIGLYSIHAGSPEAVGGWLVLLAGLALIQRFRRGKEKEKPPENGRLSHI